MIPGEANHIRREGEPRMNGEESRRALRSLFMEALEGADPRRAVSRALGDPAVARALAGARRVGVFACGKAAAAMVRALPGKLRREALVVLPRGYPAKGLSSAEVLFASHPEPDASSVVAARRALDYFSGFGPEEAVLCL